MWKEWKGYLFCQKWYIKGSGVGHRGEASPYKTLLCAPPPWGVVMPLALHATETEVQRGPSATTMGVGGGSCDPPWEWTNNNDDNNNNNKSANPRKTNHACWICQFLTFVQNNSLSNWHSAHYTASSTTQVYKWLFIRDPSEKTWLRPCFTF